MSTEAAPPERSPPVHSVTVSAQLTLHTVIAAQVGSKAKPKDKKEVKMKELALNVSPTPENYTAFLNAILAKHGEEKYNVTGKKYYPFKVLCPPTKAKADALDVDNFEDYKELVTGICAKMIKKITVYVNMVDIQKTWRKRNTHASDEDDDGHLEEEGLNDINSLTELERELARFRGLLEKKYANELDSGYTFVTSDGTALPLTPLMMKEWSRACYEGQATVKEPPNTEAFDPVKRQTALRARHTATNAHMAPQGGSDIAHLSAIVLALLGNHGEKPATPVTPTRTQPDKALTVGSPVIPTPSKLYRFLVYAEENLGVQDATRYEFLMHTKGFGPDILHLVTNEELGEMGISTGNIIRLKNGCQKWWNGPDAKRKRSDTVQQEVVVPVSKKVRYERRYVEGGGMTFFGPVMVNEGGSAHTLDYDTYYYCEARSEMVKVPLGFSVIFDDEEEDVFG